MGLVDRVRALFGPREDASGGSSIFQVHHDSLGVHIVAPPEDLARAQVGHVDDLSALQHLVLEMLAERGDAEETPTGFHLPAASACGLDDADAEVLGLPPRFRGALVPDVSQSTTSSRFSIEMSARLDGHTVPVRLIGAVAEVGDERYLLTARQQRILAAVQRHQETPVGSRSESLNVRLVADLHAAASGPLTASDEPPIELQLRHLDKFRTAVPSRVGLLAEPEADGSLSLAPDLGAGLDPDALDTQWHQIIGAGDSAVVRVDNQLVLLEPPVLAGVREVLTHPRIPRELVAEFFAAPGDFLDPELVDVDVRFGMRVRGIGAIVPTVFSDSVSSGISWVDDVTGTHGADILPQLVRTVTELDDLEPRIAGAQSTGHPLVPVGEAVVDVSDVPQTQDVLDELRRRLVQEDLDRADQAARRAEGDTERVRIGVLINEADDLAEELVDNAKSAPPRPLDLSGLRFTPKPYQREGVEWMARLMDKALDADDADLTRVRGALLADDMGLGKTFQTLFALREMQDSMSRRGLAPRPSLIIAPVALLDTWANERTAAFERAPFDDVVVLHGDRDLPFFRVRGARDESTATAAAVDADGMVDTTQIRFALKVGAQHGASRLDAPGRLVVTNYETLRKFQLSFAQVDWSAVVLDEAQFVKNPEILASRAVRALKSRFTLVATGTPVENQMRDFWSLLDIAQPGLLGTWSEFRNRWGRPLDSGSRAEVEQLGRELRELVGPYMLRRTKEDVLTDLPTKTIHSPFAGEGVSVRPDLAQQMPAVQAQVYDEVVEEYRAAAGTRGAALQLVQNLRAASLHPGFRRPEVRDDPEVAARVRVTIGLLDEIRAKGEKAIVFVIDRNVQRALALALRRRYGLPVGVVNGDVSSTGSGATRTTAIRAFEARPGFNVIVISPRAAGYGLTIVGANHAIHLERDWNPAKEAQATDRVYRIGQTRPVHVYLPMAIHPSGPSFDEKLDGLLRSKTALKDAVVVPEQVREPEMLEALGLR